MFRPCFSTDNTGQKLKSINYRTALGIDTTYLFDGLQGQRYHGERQLRLRDVSYGLWKKKQNEQKETQY